MPLLCTVTVCNIECFVQRLIHEFIHPYVEQLQLYYISCWIDSQMIKNRQWKMFDSESYKNNGIGLVDISVV